jgi:diguanylate cyclase (GGDEF)-like protein
MLAGLILLLRRRVHDVPGTLIADGVTVALAVSAVSAAIVVGTMLDEVSGRPLSVALALAYPVGDMLLISLIAGGLAGMGWRADRRWLTLAAGVSIFWLADSLYAVKAVQGSYVAGGWFDGGWWAGLLAIGLAAWAPATPRARHDSEAMRLIAVPLGFGALGLAVLVYGALWDVNVLATALAAASLVAVMARLMLTFRENVGMLRHSRREATTDPLTGLGNRRALTRALDEQIGRACEADPLVLVLFDLDGFKGYNDRFGHPAGDALLVRLGANLRGYVEDSGRAYRMGGDEFCVLLQPGGRPVGPLVTGAAAALSEHGEGFRIGCSFGVILLPLEARDASEALRVADQRMYASKNAGRRPADAQSADVLLRALTERHPDLGGHADGVAALAERTAERLGLQGDELDRVRQAARLHDIGKVAIRTRSCPSPACSTSRNGPSCAGTRSSAPGSSPRRRRSKPSPSWCGHPMSAGTARAIPIA